jgi:hypothetical protein
MSFRILSGGLLGGASFTLVACGGTVGPSPDRSESPVGAAPNPSAPNPATPSLPTPSAARECTPQADASIGSLTSSCEIAKASLVVSAGQVTWRDGNTPWRAGSRARIEVRYENRSPTTGIHYPGVIISSSDPRVVSDTEIHGPHAHPDFYMLFACQSETSPYHELRVEETLPRGTKVTLELAPITATGDGIHLCPGAPSGQLELTVP